MEKPTLTAAQIEARRAAQAFFGDLLSPVAKSQGSKAKAKSTLDKSWWTSGLTRRKPASELIRLPSAIPAMRFYTLVTQQCSCGASHSFISTPEIRFEFSARRDGLAIEVPFALPREEALAAPHRIRRITETTDLCPSCIEAALTALDSVDLPTSSLAEPRQLELFL